jgi:hypothetical protein
MGGAPWYSRQYRKGTRSEIKPLTQNLGYDNMLLIIIISALITGLVVTTI